MPGQDFIDKLVEITNIKQLSDISENFQILLSTIDINDPTFLDYITFIIEQISQDYISSTCSRQLFTETILYIQGHPNDEIAISGLKSTLSKIHTRSITFEEQIYELRNYLAARLEHTGELKEAASVLSGIPLENGQRSYDSQNKFRIYIKIAELNLLINEISEAENSANRASLLFHECKDDELILRYKLVYVQLLDRKRKFLEAGQKYYELSTKVDMVAEAKRIDYLKHALASAILSGAGQQRAKLLTILYKDERFQSLGEFSVLEKLYLDRLIDQNCLQMIYPLLNNQYASIFKEEGTDEKVWKDLIEKALVEHNMLASSQLYDNISFANLGKLVGISQEEAENVAALMISEDRLSGSIDQISGIIHFKKNNDHVLTNWSDGITNMCNSINHIVEKIELAHPEWYQQVNEAILSANEEPMPSNNMLISTEQ